MAFKLYDEIQASGYPRGLSGQIGLEQCFVLYQQQLFTDGGFNVVDGPPDAAWSNVLGAQYGSSGRFSSLDIEAWAGHPDRHTRYATMHSDFLDGHDGTGLIGSYSRSVGTLTWAQYKLGDGDQSWTDWRAFNDAAWSAMGSYITCQNPVLYFTEGPSETDHAEYIGGGWHDRATAYIEECRRLSTSLPIIPYLQPVWTNTADSGTLVSGAFWRSALEHLARNIPDGGGIIWTGPSSGNWAVDAEWWEETVDFMSYIN